MVRPKEKVSTDDSERGADRFELGLLPRIIAAGWFTLAACIPVIFFFLTFGGIWERGADHLTLSMVWIFGEVPIVTAAFFGFTVGSRIVDPLRDISAGRAALQGIGVAGLSYVVFIVFYIVSFVVQYLSRHGDSGFLVYVILLMILVSLLTIGWLIVLSGAIAGSLLCRYSCRAEVWELLLNAPRVTAGTSNAMAAVAAALVVISCVVGGVLLAMQAPKY